MSSISQQSKLLLVVMPRKVFPPPRLPSKSSHGFISYPQPLIHLEFCYKDVGSRLLFIETATQLFH